MPKEKKTIDEPVVNGWCFSTSQRAKNGTSFIRILRIEEAIEGVVPIVFGTVFNAGTKNNGLLVARNDPSKKTHLHVKPHFKGLARFLKNFTVLDISWTDLPRCELRLRIVIAIAIAEPTCPLDSVATAQDGKIFVSDKFKEPNVVVVGRHQVVHVTLQIQIEQPLCDVNLESRVPASR